MLSVDKIVILTIHSVDCYLDPQATWYYRFVLPGVEDSHIGSYQTEIHLPYLPYILLLVFIEYDG